jgi:hypothetical protein
MNPLKNKQYDLLKEIGCEDLARKVNEIVNHLNKGENATESKKNNFDDVAEAIFEADTLYDAKEILYNYVKKIKK